MTEIERPTLSGAETASLLGISRWLAQQAVHDGRWRPPAHVDADAARRRKVVFGRTRAEVRLMLHEPQRDAGGGVASGSRQLTVARLGCLTAPKVAALVLTPTGPWRKGACINPRAGHDPAGAAPAPGSSGRRVTPEQVRGGGVGHRSGRLPAIAGGEFPGLLTELIRACAAPQKGSRRGRSQAWELR